MDQQKIGQFIQARRKAIGLTQQELADKLGITNKAVSKWELGKSMPDVGLFEPLCRELDINVAELLAGRKVEDTERQKVTEQLLVESISAGKLIGLEAFLQFNSIVGVMLALSPLILHTEKPYSYLLVGFGIAECIFTIYFDHALPSKETRSRSFAVRAFYAVCLFLMLAVTSWPSAMREGIPPHIAVLPYAIGLLISLLISFFIYRGKKTDGSH